MRGRGSRCRASSPSSPAPSGAPPPTGWSRRSSVRPARVPLLAAPASGGTRIGGHAGVRADGPDHRGRRRAQVRRTPYLVYLRHPTTGGVMASWGSLGHVTVAEPGALVGFLGPRVYEALYGGMFPDRVQTAENLYAHGIIDAVSRPTRCRHPRPGAGGPGRTAARHQPAPEPGDDPTRTSTRGTRSPGRDAPTGRRTPAAAGTPPRRRPAQRHRAGRGRSRVRAALVRFGEAPCVFLGQDRAARPSTTRWARRRCGRPGAGCGWPASWGCPGDGDRHPGRGAVGRCRERRPRWRDRALPVRPGHPRRATSA